MAPIKNIASALILIVAMVATASLPMSSAVVDRTDEAALGELTPIIKTALDGVIAASPPSKVFEVKSDVVNQELVAMATMNMAQGDKEKLSAYIKAYKTAAQLVTDAAPAEKLTVMDDAFTKAANPIP
ncbi:uncharacterized protein OsI_031781-like [Hordeum vulgare subsp. vulgare]|uniref:Uncharacterized protein n=1 Tax=Hordeum vulgare subsp. vulgare TaxID=112509 RepID=A0A8I6Y8A3_HORVV|nr:uncharacterized protein OsI_031781-like [Hordeum vulgare subsp. vulgare]